MKSKFSIRITEGAFPQVMVDCIVEDEHGYRLFSVPMKVLWTRVL